MLLDLLMWGSWFALIAYVIWFFFMAKTSQPLSLDDLALTWRVHKQRNGCAASRIQSLMTENEEVIGFKCECGYEFIQKRLITQKSANRCTHKRYNRKQIVEEQNIS